MRKAAIGWMVLLGWGLLAGGAAGQHVSGALSLTSLAGYQTNPYLDPMLGEWDPSVAPGFVAVDPAVALRYSTPRVQLDLAGQARLDPGRPEQATVPLVRLSGAGQYTLASQWQIGLNGGHSWYRLNAERDTWWALPALTWQPGARSALTARAGWAGRRNALASGGTSRQTSTVGVLEGSTWLTDRWRGQLSVYRSNSRTTTGTTTYGGTGITASTTYWWTNRLALRGHATFERVDYEFAQQAEEPRGGPPIPIGGPPGNQTTTTVTVSDRLWRGGGEVNWTVRDHVTLFTRVQAMVADLQQSGTTSFDVHVGAGVRWSLGRTLAGRRATAARGLWHNADGGLRFHVRYDGGGQLYVTGEFNDWADPGVPLRPAGSNRYAATLSLPPGRYEYRIRIVEDGTTRWLELPDDARTVRDGFGGVNGVCIVE